MAIILCFYCAGQGLPSKAGQRQLKSLSENLGRNSLLSHFRMDKLKSSIVLAGERLGLKIDGFFATLNESRKWFDVWLNVDLGENDDIEILLDDDLADIRATIIKEASNELFLSSDGIVMDLFDFNDLKQEQAKFLKNVNRLAKGDLNG